MDVVVSGAAIITETNVPHEDNISYFGDGHDEPHMVYEFYAENATTILKWAQRMRNLSDKATSFNMLDTPDGVGLMGVKGILVNG